MPDKYGTGQDPYCYPGTDILINKFDIQDKVVLNEAEREITTAALNGISFSLPPYDLAYLKKLHRLLFSPIYDWAGKIRSIDISKGDTRFCTRSRIEPEANKIFSSLGNKKYFENSSPNALIGQMAALYADLNMVHPFREGNGRTQRILFEHIALNCGYGIDWGVASTTEWLKANAQGANCEFMLLEAIFQSALSEIA